MLNKRILVILKTETAAVDKNKQQQQSLQKNFRNIAYNNNNNNNNTKNSNGIEELKEKLIL